MPYKHIKKKIPRELDRRVKLSEQDKEHIRELYKVNTPIREIARIYTNKCSRRMIQFVIFPERLEQLAKKHIKEKSHLKYYNKDKWRETQKEHRHYKQELYLKNKLQ